LDGDGVCSGDVQRPFFLFFAAVELHGGRQAVVEDDELCKLGSSGTSLFFLYFLGLFVQMCWDSCGSMF
jgi:hypothetical protein